MTALHLRTRTTVVCAACGKVVTAHRHQPPCGRPHAGRREHHGFTEPVTRVVTITRTGEEVRDGVD